MMRDAPLATNALSDRPDRAGADRGRIAPRGDSERPTIVDGRHFRLRVSRDRLYDLAYAAGRGGNLRVGGDQHRAVGLTHSARRVERLQPDFSIKGPGGSCQRARSGTTSPFDPAKICR